MFIFFPFNLFLGYVYLSSVLINYTPPHWCKVIFLLFCKRNVNNLREKKSAKIMTRKLSMQLSFCQLDFNKAFD